MISELFQEVFTSMRNNRLRITLTGFAIGWGIFILIVMLGSGNGLLKGIRRNFASWGDNIIYLTSGSTTLPYPSKEKGYPVYLEEEDGIILESKFPRLIQKAYPEYGKQSLAVYREQYMSIYLTGMIPGYQNAVKMHMRSGRDINGTDIAEKRKVCVLTRNLADILFGEKVDPVGLFLNVDGIPFQVAGTCEPDDTYNIIRSFYVPLSTAMSLYQPDGHISKINLVTKNLDTPGNNAKFTCELQEFLSGVKSYNPEDKKAIIIENPHEMYSEVKGFLNTIEFFIWIIGLATLAAGVVGVSNIMFITVRERTRELGIRKALGDKNRNIVKLVLLESVTITVIFGYIGILLGIGITSLVTNLLPALGLDAVFGAMTVKMSSITGATVVMILSGLAAGYFPAKRAVSLKVVDALSSKMS